MKLCSKASSMDRDLMRKLDLEHNFILYVQHFKGQHVKHARCEHLA